MKKTTVKWHGAQAKIRARSGAVAGLTSWADGVLESAKTLVPVSQSARGGSLRDTGKVEVDPARMRACVSFDQLPDAPHIAIYVHERLDVQHEDGKQAKFLESPTNASKLTGPAKVAAAMRKTL
jgi:hypothetical protein